MVAIPVWMPADPEIDASEIPAVSKTAVFQTEQQYLLREQKPGSAWFSIIVYIVLAGIAMVWTGLLIFAGRANIREGERTEGELARV